MKEKEDEVKINVWLYIVIIAVIMLVVFLIGMLLFYYRYVKLDFSGTK